MGDASLLQLDDDAKVAEKISEDVYESSTFKEERTSNEGSVKEIVVEHRGGQNQLPEYSTQLLLHDPEISSESLVQDPELSALSSFQEKELSQNLLQDPEPSSQAFLRDPQLTPQVSFQDPEPSCLVLLRDPELSPRQFETLWSQLPERLNLFIDSCIRT